VPFDGLDIGLSYGRRRCLNEPGKSAVVRGCSLQNSRTDGIDAQTARKLDCGCWHEVLQGAVGKGGGRASSNRFPPDHPSGEGERSAVCDVRDALSHDLDLAERFVRQGGEKVVAL
jgi:hypothetical protein